MALAFTSAELLVDVREQSRFGEDDPSATSTIILREATRVLHALYVPAVRSVRSEYYTIEATIALESGRAAYPIPRRATAASVRRVRLLDTASNERHLIEASIEDISRNHTASIPTHYAVLDDRIVLHPVPTAASVGTYLRIAFEYRPGALIETSAAYQPAIYFFGSNAFDPSATGHYFSMQNTSPPFVDGDLIDVVRMDPPFSVVIMDGVADVTVSASDQLEFTSWMGPQDEAIETDATILPRLYVCYAGETPIPQIPAEMHPILALHTAAKLLKPIDPQMANELRADADAQLAEQIKIMAPRKVGGQRKVRPRSSTLRRGGRGGWGGRNTFEDL